MVVAAFVVKTKVVLFVTDNTVPITTFKAVLMMFPTRISVVKSVPEPVTVAVATEVVMVPVLKVLGHAVALQLPVARLVTAAAFRLVAVSIKISTPNVIR